MSQDSFEKFETELHELLAKYGLVLRAKGPNIIIRHQESGEETEF